MSFTPTRLVNVDISQAELGLPFVAATQMVNDPELDIRSQLIVDDLTNVHMMRFGPDIKTPEALVVMLSFGNYFVPHNVEKGRYIHAASQALGMATEAGDPLPLYLVAAPGKFSGPSADVVDLKATQNGDFGSVAVANNEALQRAGVQRVRQLGGFSYGSSMAVRMGGVASELQYDRLAVAEPGDAFRRSKPRLGLDFMLQPSWKLEAKAGGVKAYTDATKQDSVARYGATILGAKEINGATFGGLSQGRFEESLILAASATKVDVAYGDRSRMSPAHIMEAMLDRAQRNEAVARQIASLRVRNGQHTWENLLPLLTAFYLDKIPAPQAA